jgi:hypothetical protein
MNAITISADKNKVDVVFVHDFLSKLTYWAKGRTMEEVKTTIQFSEVFSVFKNNKQIGFARVTTDYVALAYLADVFIVETERNNGYSKQLLDFIFNHDPLKKVSMWRLMSTDARGLYAKYGFTPLAHPEKMMEWKRIQN